MIEIDGVSDFISESESECEIQLLTDFSNTTITIKIVVFVL